MNVNLIIIYFKEQLQSRLRGLSNSHGIFFLNSPHEVKGDAAMAPEVGDVCVVILVVHS